MTWIPGTPREALDEIDRLRELVAVDIPYVEGVVQHRAGPGWYGVACRHGWFGIVARLDRAIHALRGDYELYQCKEKFGGLRYYCSADGDPAISTLIQGAELEAWRTCERCGSTLDVTTDPLEGRYWIVTWCGACRAGLTEE